jgi:hypothetical protein
MDSHSAKIAELEKSLAWREQPRDGRGWDSVQNFTSLDCDGSAVCQRSVRVAV